MVKGYNINMSLLMEFMMRVIFRFVIYISPLPGFSMPKFYKLHSSDMYITSIGFSNVQNRIAVICLCFKHQPIFYMSHRMGLLNGYSI